MKSSDKSNLIIEEANSIINSFIKKKSVKQPKVNIALFLSILTIGIALFMIFVIINI